MEKRFTLSWEISAHYDGTITRDFLKDHSISKASLTAIKFQGGFIKVNNQDETVRYILKEGDVLEVAFPLEKRSENIKAEKMPLDILYEDEHFLVVNKRAGIATIPSREHQSGTLSNALLYYYVQNDIHATLHFVNRLDKDTSGLLVVAKHRYSHYLFSKAQQSHKIHRFYQAFVHGVPAEEGTVSASIGRADDSIIKREVVENGQHAVTHYKVLERFKEAAIVELSLETGRTHQIRVHMSYIGHPLLGDDLYGGKQGRMNRQALHCYKMEFKHPFTGQYLSFIGELPEDMLKCQRELAQ
ncbi:RluA family pseudouridine synthase [Priestia filamentosa]|uniref:RluA family pseudouridine synthase n=1 Tax=Priestia filamentosa TaxID=1402861 RepID=UPI001FB30B4B|nr:RluA family pseudouridine synthase [Priestia filamentosa]MED3726559.1 RluA family pseudouridine synthase [Priestia filamentosa]UOE59937.1 RluA family pseudouridine synthase [Priestia filamentosa]